MIIDFHTHTFPDKIAAAAIDKLARVSRTIPYSDGTVTGLAASMEQAGIDYSVNMPVMTSVAQVEKVNSSLMRSQEQFLQQGILTFGGMHPDYENYRAELKRLKENGFLGIKLHPAYQSVDLDDIRMMRIIDCASELGLITLTHAGIDIGIYEHNYCSVSHVLHVLDQVHPEKFVLAHMGNWGCWDEVERDLAGAPVWLDTAFSIGTIAPNPDVAEPPYQPENLPTEDFLRIARKHGTGRILFATDSPWSDQQDYVARFLDMPLTEQEREEIFSKNALALLGLTLPERVSRHCSQ